MYHINSKELGESCLIFTRARDLGTEDSGSKSLRTRAHGLEQGRFRFCGVLYLFSRAVVIIYPNWSGSKCFTSLESKCLKSRCRQGHALSASGELGMV